MAVSRVLGSFSWLCEHSRPLLVRGDDISVLLSPQKYYEWLKEQVLSAKERILLSSLYLGTGKLEQELVSALECSLNSNPHLQCVVVLDYLRGNRGHFNSRSMFQRLLENYSHQFHLYMYHTPHLRGILKEIFPERLNEVIGLQHTKIYLFDDNIMLTGANLSNDYFTNRQDRYIVFKSSPNFADKMASLHHIISQHSFVMKADGSTDKPPATPSNPLQSRRNAMHYKLSFQEAIQNAVNIQSEPSNMMETGSHSDMDMKTEYDTVVFPLIQMGQYYIKHDERVTQKILADVKLNEHVYLASGYFNLPQVYSEAIINSSGLYNILASSPQANCFYTDSGASKYVPSMYIYFATQFLKQLYNQKQENRVQYLEYYRPNWTFHSKGLWYYLAHQQYPSLTLVGSSNYGHRSLTRDLEIQVAMVTENPALQQALHNEQMSLYQYGHKLSYNEVIKDTDRKLSFWVWLATKLLQSHV